MVDICLTVVFLCRSDGCQMEVCESSCTDSTVEGHELCCAQTHSPKSPASLALTLYSLCHLPGTRTKLQLCGLVLHLCYLSLVKPNLFLGKECHVVSTLKCRGWSFKGSFIFCVVLNSLCGLYVLR